MARENILETKIEQLHAQGYCLYKRVNGKNSTAPQSALERSIRDLKSMLGDKLPNFEIITVVGAKRRYRTQGNKMAIMFRKLSSAL